MEEPIEKNNVGVPLRKKLKLTKIHEPTVDEVYEKDLPILSNVDQVHIDHYLMSLKFNFDKKVIHGTLVIFPKLLLIDRIPEEIILDSCSLQVKNVSSLNLNLKDLSTNPVDLYNYLTQLPVDKYLEFVVNKWSLTIKLPSSFPTAVKIEYETLPSSPSVQWRPSKGFNSKDDTIPLCCYTPAAPVNNRGLFPCQEAPISMATWTCFTILADKSGSAFLSSDQPGIIIETDDDELSISYFNCSEILPMSTFAFIANQLSPHNVIEIEQPKDSCCCEMKNEQKPSTSAFSCQQHQVIPVRIIFQNDTFLFDVAKLSTFIGRLLQATNTILGPSPFQRLDIIMMPECFPTIGLCNPNMIFLSSPCVLTGENPLIYSRLTHEIGHFWFGLCIGALDWTEEWLSEGFATYTEDIFHRIVLEQILEESKSQLSKSNADATEVKVLEKAIQELKLKPCIRLVTLQQELENTNSSWNKADEDLQRVQQPNHCENLTLNKIVNGLDPMKQFIQVHYLKGYFFLMHLSSLVGGESEFLKFLQAYTLKFKGELVTSSEFLNFFKAQFCTDETNNFSTTKLFPTIVDSLSKKWLQQTTLPEPYKSVNVCQPTIIISDNVQRLFPDCIYQLMKVNSLTIWFNCQTTNTNFSLENYDHLNLNATEKLLFLEQILDSNQNLEQNHIAYLEKSINSETENPEIQHRMCEIIVKSNCLSKMKTVENFLLDYPAMGVYLYAELIISEKKKFQKLARKLYENRKDVMDPPCVHVLQQMIF